ncbi:hypothetical protein [Nibricoccus sp. IMCC34717]|uniref:hypothetical protein n=1 Tax=Nibricoccus sp. IMCC34717 TaxID=3034021 RepID=UPI003850132B
MPTEVKLSDGVLRITLRGQIVLEDLIAVVEQSRPYEVADRRAPNRFTDISEANAIMITFEDMSLFARRRTEATLPNRVKNAVFAPTEVHYGLARMFEQMNRNPNIELCVFRTRDEAWAWLNA